MRYFIAFFIALVVYVLLTFAYMKYFSNIKIPIPHKNNHVIKIDIRDIPDPISIPKIQTTPTITKPIVKETVTKKIEKKKPIIKKKPKPKKKPVVKKKPKPKPKPKKVIKKKPIVVKNKAPRKVPTPIEEFVYIPEPLPEPVEEYVEEMVYIPEPMFVPTPQTTPIVEVENHSDDLASFLSTPSPSQPTTQSAYPSKKVRKLYGSTFHNMTATQKEFIENNLDKIQGITQQTLTRRGYPDGAGQTGQEGTNVVSFNLHPNGNISDLRLKTRIGYRLLDENTLSLIRVAYMDYPYPSSTTKIIFYVTYSIYGY